MLIKSHKLCHYMGDFRCNIRPITINFTVEQITILALYQRKISILYWICT